MRLPAASAARGNNNILSLAAQTLQYIIYKYNLDITPIFQLSALCLVDFEKLQVDQGDALSWFGSGDYRAHPLEKRRLHFFETL